MNHGSLCSGVGGFNLAAHWEGIENVFSVEVDDKASAVMEKRFPNCKHYKNIFDFDGKKYREAVDIISAGFPC